MKLLSGLLSVLFFWRKKKSIVPVVRLSGVISASGGVRRGLSLEGVEPQLKKAFSVNGARAVALIVNSPGGSPVQSALIGQRIRELAKRPMCRFWPFAKMWRPVVVTGLRLARIRSMRMRPRWLVRSGLFPLVSDLIVPSKSWAWNGGSIPLVKTR